MQNPCQSPLVSRVGNNCLPILVVFTKVFFGAFLPEEEIFNNCNLQITQLVLIFALLHLLKKISVQRKQLLSTYQTWNYPMLSPFCISPAPAIHPAPGGGRRKKLSPPPPENACRHPIRKICDSVPPPSYLHNAAVKKCCRDSTGNTKDNKQAFVILNCSSLSELS